MSLVPGPGPSARGDAMPAPRWAVVGLFLMLAVAALGYAKEFLVPIVLAFLLAMVFGPVRRFFDRRGVPTVVTSLAIVLLLLVGLVAVVTALALPVASWVADAPRIGQEVEDKLSSLSGTFDGLFEANQQLNALVHATEPNVQAVEIRDSGMATTILLLAPGAVTQFAFTLILLLFLLASGDMFYEKLVHVLPSFRDKRTAMRIAHDIERKLSRYLLTITVINAGLGVAIGTVMWLYGMPTPLVFAVIAFLFNFIPYLGALGGIVISGIVALVAFDGVALAILVPATYFAITSIEGQIITPYFVGRSLKLNTVVVFLAVSFWAWLWSAIGMIVAVPLLVAIRTFCEHIPHMTALGDFLSERHAELDSEPVPPPTLPVAGEEPDIDPIAGEGTARHHELETHP
ncbi:AI-2E family transporter [Aureimonas jatrophae]|uniref:Predicted PurR-regulated permease PerM n=1 Tax=Aureimonas jatrophae TaxID=1166073 RepID=A0A1H0HX35_9HYPH|nr:AI-2E family transporter [Aureimonas jatrophae]MBB3950823.1 putative PurR-regulated permease PerM [Aureimonas jatrophae]SDO23766.1 Predicted PurR-regulated permease PerM [Aureimonas jatrophae]